MGHRKGNSRRALDPATCLHMANKLLTIPYTREHNDRSFYLKLVAAMGRYIYGVYLFMG